MTPALKQRLVGAAVLVALAVIFLPMLLDGSGARENLDQALAIPDQPEAPASQLEPAASSDDGDGPMNTQSGDTTAGSDASPPEAEAGAADSKVSASTDDEAATESGTSTDTTNNAAADSSASTATERDDAETTPQDDASDREIDKGWVIQVGSFQKKANAVVMRDRLRHDDFDATAARADANGSTLWRVRLGPVAERAAAKALLQRYQQSHSGDALLMAYP